jgi:hypothetical protein
MRYDAYIEVNTHRFKDGTIQLEKADKKNGFIESYTITFYGNLVQLKDIIKDDKLQSLDYTIFNHPYDSIEVRNRISLGTSYSIRYPLIGNANKYTYQDGTATDITTIGGAIKWNELFPAITVENIFRRIQAKYAITFTGSFFNLKQWTELYLYLKPSLAMTYTSETLNFNFTSKSSSFPELNLDTDTLTPNFNFPSPVPSGQDPDRRSYVVYMRIIPQSGFTNIPYTFYIYKNGLLFKTFNNVGDRTYFCDADFETGYTSSNYTFKISANASFSYTATLSLKKTYYNANGGFGSDAIVVEKYGFTSVQSVVSNIPIGNYMPDIKIIDFITGIIKAFNLMIIPRPNNIYEFAPLELYYNAGKILDITEYTYEDEMSINKPKLFKSINFTYEESNNILNQAYKGLYQQNYGDLIYNSDRITESSTYDIKLPFENVLFELVKQDKLFQTATLIDKDLKPYVPKPMLIYMNQRVTGLTGTDQIYVTNSTGAATQINAYNRFSNEYDNLPTDPNHSQLMTMNFGNEQSSWLNEFAPQGLYFRHYKNFIDNLYNIKTRLIKVKALLPPSLLGSTVTNGDGIPLGIALNDRLVIRNKRYLINSFTTDLTTGETDLELLTDYRGVDAASTIGYRFGSFENIDTDNKELSIDVEIYLNDYDYFEVKGKTSFITCTLSGNNKNDILLPVTITQNTTGVDRSGTIQLVYYRGTTQKDEFIIVTQTA